jgi:hypothetical protein
MITFTKYIILNIYTNNIIYPNYNYTSISIAIFVILIFIITIELEIFKNPRVLNVQKIQM